MFRALQPRIACMETQSLESRVSTIPFLPKSHQQILNALLRRAITVTLRQGASYLMM